MEFSFVIDELSEANKFASGGFGSIHRVLVGSKLVAVKVVENKNYGDSLDYKSEYRILKHLDVPGSERFITKLLHFCETDRKSFFVFEYYRTDLFSVNRHEKTVGKELFYVKKVAECVQFLHDQRVIHRDIKPENILLGFNEQVVLCDFGHAIEFPEPGKLLYSYAGTYEYMSPEMSFKTGYDCSVDIWSLGVLYYELLIVPLTVKEGKQIEKGNIHVFDCSRFPKIQKDSIVKILKKNPKERPTIEEILEF